MVGKNYLLLLLIMLLPCFIYAQLDLGYQKPSEEILDLADAPSAPRVRITRDGKTMVLLEQSRYKSIEELSEQEMRLGGLRINPKTRIGSRTRYYTGISVMQVGEKDAKKVTGLPENVRLANFEWSPDQSLMAFTLTKQTGVELWVLNVQEATCKKISEPVLNAAMGQPYVWFPDSKSLLVSFLPSDLKPLIDKAENVPVGPTVSVNDGKKAQNRTYQDLLKDKADEFNFEQLARSTLFKLGVDGTKKEWKETAMYSGVSFSPDGEYVMITTIERPFSYLVPFYRFPSTTIIYDVNGKLVKKILEVPLIEELPQGFMAVRQGKRDLQWRDDKPATLIWAVALDEGDPEKKIEYRDEIFELEAPFAGKERSVIKTINRFYKMVWGDDNLAIAYDYWWNTRNTKTYAFNPSKNTQKPVILFDRNYQDKYSEPGSFATYENEYKKKVLYKEKTKLFLLGSGYSEKGVFPFVDRFDSKTKQTKRLWQASDANKLEKVYFAVDMKKRQIFARIESANEYPNYYIRNIKKKDSKQQLTYFKNPFESIEQVHKEVIKYKRADGVDLSATLYLPVGYDKTKKEKLPMIMWAYPTEFKDKASAGQVTTSPNEFTYPWYGSPLFWLTKGYIVLDDASFPIVGEGDEEPNDSFIEQLVGNAKAAIEAVDKLDYVDTARVAVGGHSYGAFMTANLLTHSNLFAAGIARSGAYNRTLTPFGFQREERNYWEAPNIYYEMSPFMHCEKMKTPLLLIHGQADNNSGTYPMQSERYFNALKGLGATVRLVMLPKESHGYSARESVLHLLWEQDQWLEKYVKNKGKN